MLLLLQDEVIGIVDPVIKFPCLFVNCVEILALNIRSIGEYDELADEEAKLDDTENIDVMELLDHEDVIGIVDPVIKFPCFVLIKVNKLELNTKSIGAQLELIELLDQEEVIGIVDPVVNWVPPFIEFKAHDDVWDQLDVIGINEPVIRLLYLFVSWVETLELNTKSVGAQDELTEIKEKLDVVDQLDVIW